MTVSERVAARVLTDFRADLVDEVLGRLAGAFTGNQDVDRVHAAVVPATCRCCGRRCALRWTGVTCC